MEELKNIRRNEKIANIERLRILGAFGIVWFHNQNAPLRSIGYAGLPIFLLVFISLIVRYSHFHDFTGFTKRRAYRLLLPWLFWSAVYGVCMISKAVLQSEPILENFSASTFLVGTRIHLWYLPYSFGIALCLYFINKFSSEISDLTIVLTMLFFSVATLGASSATMSYSMPVPLPQWLFGLSSLPLGIAIGRCCYIINKRTEILLMTTIASVAIISCLLLVKMGYTNLALPYSIGTVLVCIAHLWHGHYGKLTQFAAPLTYGIYLIHPLVGNVLESFIIFKQSIWLGIFATFFVSALVTLCIKRSFLRIFV